MQSVANIPIRRGFVALTVAFALVIGCTWGVVKVASDYLLHHNTKMAAQGWARLLVPGIPDIGRIAAGERPSAESLAFFDWAHRAGSLFRFEIYDRQGNLQLASEPGFMLMDRSGPSGDALRVVSTGEPILSVREGAPGPSAFFGHALVPVLVDGRPIAAIGTYVDQTPRRDQFHGMFITAAASLSLLTALAFGIPTAAWYRRTREKDAAERRVLDNARRAEQLAEQALAQHGRFEAALANMPHGLCMFDERKRLVICNARYREMYDLPASLVAPGTPLEKIIEYRRRIGNAPKEFPNYVTHDGIDFAVGNNSVFEFALEDGRTIRINHLPLSGGGYVATHEDVSRGGARRDADHPHGAARRAHRSSEPGVLPREAAARPSKRRRRKPAWRCSASTSTTSRASTRRSATRPGTSFSPPLPTGCAAASTRPNSLARLGEDEFAIVQVDCDQPAGATRLARAIIEAIGRPYDVAGQQVDIAASMGIALAPDDGDDPDSLLKNADLALYRAQGDGREPFCFFEPTMDATMQARRRLEIGLRRALVQEEFELHYQPLVNLESNSLTGFEALLRWRDPDRGLVPPGEFIPLAEETGLIVPIGEWVVRRACADAANWPRNLRVAVNLSPAQFKGRQIITVVFGALAAAHLAAGRLELEITESVLLDKNDDTLAILHQLREFGVRISMDDFGTGYSSLSYLRSFPFDKIKIDQSFVRDLTGSDNSLAIVRAVAGLGAALGITTTAEGVETPEQLECLRREGCTEVQGYLFGRPRPSAQLEEFLADPNWFGAIAAIAPHEERRPQRATG